MLSSEMAFGVLLALFAVVGCARAEPAWRPAGLLNVAPASQFVAGPTSMDWYHHDEPEAVHFVSNRYCGDIGYGVNIHLSCDEGKQGRGIFGQPEHPEVGTCVLGGGFYAYEIYPHIGAGAFTGTCYMRNAESCGAPECSEVELHVTGTAFLLENSFALSNPKVGDNYDDNCIDIMDDNKMAGGRKLRKERRMHKGKAGRKTNTTTAELAAADSLDNRRGYKQEDGPYAHAKDLPEDVYKGWTYIYKGYFEAISTKKTRKVGSGTFELVWPVDGGEYNWEKSSKDDLKDGALMIKKPYIATFTFWDSDTGEPKAGYREEHRHD